MQQTIGNIIILIGIIFVSIGVIGIFRFDNYFARALVASKVDTVGYITLMLGVIVKSGFRFFSFKLLVILIITFLVNPLITHAIVRSAYISGSKGRKE